MSNVSATQSDAIQTHITQMSVTDSNELREIEFNGWSIEFDMRDANRIYIKRTGKPGHIHINATDEGLITDIWPDSFESVHSTCSALYSDLETLDEDDAACA